MALKMEGASLVSRPVSDLGTDDLPKGERVDAIECQSKPAFMVSAFLASSRCRIRESVYIVVASR